MGVDQDLGPLSWGLTITFFTICAISFALRIYARGFVFRSFAWDDRFMAIAFILLIGQQYICWEWLILGAAKHVQSVTFEGLRKMRLYQFIEQFYYYAVQLFIKLSFLVYFHRALYTPRLSTAIRIVALVVLLQTIATWIFYGLQCRPLAGFFHPDGYPNAACISSRITYSVPTAINAAVNLLIYVLPIPTLARQAQNQGTTTPATTTSPTPQNTSPSPSPERPSTPTRSTPATIALFTISGAGVIVSFLRIAVLYHWSTTASTDYPYTLGVVAIVTTIELTVYVFAGNLPALRALRQPPLPGTERHEMRSTRRRRRRGVSGGGDESEDELWGVGKGGEITITSRVSISITEALRGAQGVQRDGAPNYPKKYFRFARPGARSPTPNFLKEMGA